MLLGAGDNTLRLFQKNNIFSRERPIWQDKSRGDDSWQYGQVSVSGVAQHQVKRDLFVFHFQNIPQISVGKLSSFEWNLLH